MHVISKKPFIEASLKFPNCAKSIMATYKVLKKGYFKTPEELKSIFGSLDNLKYKAGWYVIDIGGNHLRLIVNVQFTYQRVFVKHIVTHAEYDKLTQRAKRGDI